MVRKRKEPVVLLLGDIAIFYVSLFVALFLRYQEMPRSELLSAHLAPFSVLFAVWILSFFIAGLYEKQTTVLVSRLPSKIFNAQIANSVIAVVFFYFLPVFQITPKTNLFLCLALSFLFILYWRLKSVALEAEHKGKAVLIGSGAEVLELENEINRNPRYALRIVEWADLDAIGPEAMRLRLKAAVEEGKAEAVIADFNDDRMAPILPELYNFLFSKIRFMGIDDIYEDIFDRIPLSVIGHSWFLENISAMPKRIYDMLKRAMDIALSFVLFIISLPIYPLVWLAITLDDRGNLFIVQERAGQNGKRIQIVKFRSMTQAADIDLAKDSKARVTRIGRFLRKTRIDELPQLWNVLRGDLSLIGPRPELPALVSLYEKEIPYYNIRHLIKPGLSGWAQLYQENHPHHGEAIEETREKLSYDLYYVKNRSFMLDLKIALRTIQALLSRSGR